MSSQSPLIDPTQARSVLRVGDRSYAYYRLDAAGADDLARLPYTVKILSVQVDLFGSEPAFAVLAPEGNA